VRTGQIFCGTAANLPQQEAGRDLADYSGQAFTTCRHSPCTTPSTIHNLGGAHLSSCHRARRPRAYTGDSTAAGLGRLPHATDRMAGFISHATHFALHAGTTMCDNVTGRALACDVRWRGFSLACRLFRLPPQRTASRHLYTQHRTFHPHFTAAQRAHTTGQACISHPPGWPEGGTTPAPHATSPPPPTCTPTTCCAFLPFLHALL